MANETYDSSEGYIVLPVLHPSSDLHNISVAEDTPDRGSTLRAASEYSHPAIEVHEKQRTADDALEKSDSLRVRRLRVYGWHLAPVKDTEKHR